MLSLLLVPIMANAQPEYQTRAPPVYPISITAPYDGATVSGTVAITVECAKTPEIFIFQLLT